jgi:hypothetical protein
MLRAYSKSPRCLESNDTGEFVSRFRNHVATTKTSADSGISLAKCGADSILLFSRSILCCSEGSRRRVSSDPRFTPGMLRPNANRTGIGR